MPIAKVQSRGQVTLPSKLRKKIGCRPGDTLVIEATGPGEARLKVLPRLTLQETLEHYRITGPIDWHRDREEADEQAAREFVETMARHTKP